MRIAIVVLMAGVLLVAACGAQPTALPTEVPFQIPPTEAAPTAAPPTTAPTEEPFESPLPPEVATGEPFESPLEPADGTFDSPLGLANPASVYCGEQGYVLEIRTGAAGEAGYCIFPDGTECEEWAYYRGECAPGTPAP